MTGTRVDQPGGIPASPGNGNRNGALAGVPALTVYYDGLCHLCAIEMDHYRKHDPQGRLTLVDITAPGFDARAQGLDPDAVLRVMHIRTANGQVLTAVDAFLRIWEVMGWFAPLRWLFRKAWFRPLVDFAYHSFARARPWLPRKACANGYCDPLRRPR